LVSNDYWKKHDQLLLGTTIAYTATGYPERRAAMQIVGGVLLLAGLGLMGYVLEAALGHP
jgi:hypothetical protein